MLSKYVMDSESWEKHLGQVSKEVSKDTHHLFHYPPDISPH